MILPAKGASKLTREQDLKSSILQGRRLPTDCPMDATVLHPIGPADFLVLSEASLQGCGIVVLADRVHAGQIRIQGLGFKCTV